VTAEPVTAGPAPQVSNWGRWGDDDELGTLNLIDAAAVKRGAACVQTGKAFSLAIPLMNGVGVTLMTDWSADTSRA